MPCRLLFEKYIHKRTVGKNADEWVVVVVVPTTTGDHQIRRLDRKLLSSEILQNFNREFINNAVFSVLIFRPLVFIKTWEIHIHTNGEFKREMIEGVYLWMDGWHSPRLSAFKPLHGLCFYHGCGDGFEIFGRIIASLISHQQTRIKRSQRGRRLIDER